MFVLGIDPGLRTTGYGVIERRPAGLGAVAAGAIRTDPRASTPVRLRELYRDVQSLLDEHVPDSMAVEKLFVNRNLQTASAVGQASGVVLLAAAEAGVDVFEYTPSEVKIAVTGYGGAPKEQVTRMVANLLDLGDRVRPIDAADALATALCHLNTSGLRAAVARAE